VVLCACFTGNKVPRWRVVSCSIVQQQQQQNLVIKDSFIAFETQPPPSVERAVGHLRN